MEFHHGFMVRRDQWFSLWSWTSRIRQNLGSTVRSLLLELIMEDVFENVIEKALQMLLAYIWCIGLWHIQDNTLYIGADIPMYKEKTMLVYSFQTTKWNLSFHKYYSVLSLKKGFKMSRLFNQMTENVKWEWGWHSGWFFYNINLIEWSHRTDVYG